MAVTSVADKTTLAVRVRNGQTSSGDWRYKNVSIAGVAADLDLSNAQVQTQLENMYGALSTNIVGTTDGMRVVSTRIVSVSA